MPRYCLELEFAGAAFNGTQLQAEAGGRTLNGVVEQALTELAGEPVSFRASSRLDQGVGARALPGDCRLAKDWDPPVLGLALNQRLPDDVVVRRVARVDDGFDARKDAIWKSYRYRVLVRPVRPVLDRAGMWVRRMPYPELLDELAALIPGVRDLSGFAALRHDETDAKSPRREYLSAAWSLEHSDEATVRVFRICGKGFLYKQVRGLVGAMVHVAMGRDVPAAFHAALAAGRDAVRVGNIAPAEGLLLERVAFDPEPYWRPVVQESPRAR